MPPRKPRQVKSTAPSPSPGPVRSLRAQRGGSKLSESTTVGVVEEENVQVTDEGSSEKEQDDGQQQQDAEEDRNQEIEGERQIDEEDEDAREDGETEGTEETGKVTMADRMQKLKELRARMNASTVANRKDLIADHQKAKVTAKELARLEKQRKLAQTLRLKADAEETGEDLERKKAWEWSIEQNERWEAKMADQAVRADGRFHNAEDEAHKQYNRNVRVTKPDLVAYERAKEAALGLAPGTLVPANATSASLVAAGPSKAKGLSAAEDLYRGMDTLAYGDSKPSEDAVDRVVGKINKDLDKGKRKKKEEEDETVTYINQRNKVFNKKVARYFDKYTKEIRASFERGTAL
ncbi:pre-mRNA-splicing factor SYF2 [Tremella mesenterica]|uniref:Pre-mRNA-splicing factor SYF2 n=1 Tax=Tremella mesenterica TaxID=5217 RepID=A0A4Q1BP73_TREME|nr:pre-mRNA-splicing factor SYF2 [Tremella mesenterica]